MRDILADLLPEKASTLRMQNCANGLKLTFHGITEDSDITWVKQNVHQATNAYHEGHCVTFSTKSPAEQRDAIQRLRGLKDGRHAVTVAAIENEINREDLHIDPQPLSLQIQPNTDEMDASEGPAPITSEPTTHTRRSRVESDVKKIQGDMQDMNKKITNMPGDTIAAVRKYREEERRRDLPEPQSHTQPTNPTVPIPMKRAKDLAPPIDAPAMGSSAWVVRKEENGKRVPLNAFVTAVPGPTSPSFTVLAYQQDGSLNTTAPYQCTLDNCMLEEQARNLATIA